MQKHEIKSVADLIEKIDELHIQFEKILEEKCGCDWNQNATCFYDMGLDELDVIAVVIEVEEKFGLNVWDYVVEEMFSVRPQTLIASRIRNERLDDIGI